MLLLELESHLASAIKLPPGQAVHTLAQRPHEISSLKQKQRLQAGSFPSAVRLQEGSALCIYRAVKTQVRFLMHSTLQLGLGSLYVIE